MELTLSTNPDLIVLGGDYVTFGDRDFVEPVAELLSPLRAPNGVFAILGNHDDDREMPAALARKGITVLKDQRTQGHHSRRWSGAGRHSLLDASPRGHRSRAEGRDRFSAAPRS